jgi:hypothetical protein
LPSGRPSTGPRSETDPMKVEFQPVEAEAVEAEKEQRAIGFVMLMDVLEHQPDDGAFLTELVSKMEPGATLILSVPASRRLWSDWDVALGHHRRYDRTGLRRLFETVPVSVREVSYLFPELVPAAWVRKWRRRSAPAQAPAEEAQFPHLPTAINEALYGLARATLRLRPRWLAGTSLFAVVSRN